MAKSKQAEPLQFLSKPQKEFCRLIISGESSIDAFKQAFPNHNPDRVSKDCPLLLKSPVVVAELNRLRLLSPKASLLERTQALINSGSLRPDKELEAIELVTQLIREVSEESKVEETGADLDEFMQAVVHKRAVAFR